MKTEKRRIVFIVNPISGTSDKKGFDSLVEKTIDRNIYDYDIRRTEYAGHAAEMATQCATNGIDICVAVGGDGTVNEVARSITNTDTALGIVPCGSGNGLARHLELPMNMKKALSIINQGNTDNFDYGIINGHPFFCTCGMGFDAHVSHLFAQSDKRGLTTYAKMVLAEGMKYAPTNYVITFENNEGETIHQNAFLIACANAAQYGNNTYIAPGASMQDGLLDVIIIEPFNGLGGPKVLMDMLTKTLKSNSHVICHKAKKIHVERPDEGPVHFDGDPFIMGNSIDIEIVPKGLKAIINSKHIEDEAKPNKVLEKLNNMMSHKAK
jgi:YegS/Rv2252/BmrU family lipid kinase